MKLNDIRSSFAQKFSLTDQAASCDIWVNWGEKTSFLLMEDSDLLALDQNDVLTLLDEQAEKGDVSMVFILKKNYGSVLPDHLKSFAAPDRPTISYFINNYPNAYSIKCLELRSNDLDDKSFSAVVDAVLQRFSNLEVLDLTNNSLTENSTNDLSRLLSHTSLKWVVIKNNTRGLSTIDSSRWFSSLKPSDLKKLIFLHKEWLESKGWRVLVSEDSNKVNIVKKSHETYYQTICGH